MRGFGSRRYTQVQWHWDGAVLQEGMGFWDRDANVRALQATAGNVNAAVDRLLSS